MEDKTLIGDPIDRHQNQLSNVEDTNDNARTDQKQYIFEIESTSGIDDEESDFGGAF